MRTRTQFPQEAIELFNEHVGFSFQENVYMACRRGSHCYGLDTDDSDEDFFAVVIPPREKILGLTSFDNWKLQEGDLDVVVYSLDKYVKLLLKANPTVLETLWYDTQHYDKSLTHPEFWFLVSSRKWFNSIQVFYSFNGYAGDQLRRMTKGEVGRKMGEKRKRLVEKFGYDVKNALHLMRLYKMGTEFVETGSLIVNRQGVDDDILLEVKRGLWSLERVQEAAELMSARLERAKENSPLPEKPNTAAAERYLIETTLAHITTP